MENKSQQTGNLVSSSNFRPQKAVGWFNPILLAETGVSALISSVFGAFSDKREMQAALDHTDKQCHDFSLKEEIWFDYVSDVGDGFNPTYTIAKALAESQIALEEIKTQRGEILIMGGDQVYPKASRELYNDRLKGPYASAFPEGSSPKKPNLFAIPGNHDWYDGLSNFLKIFCQQRTIGNWQTCQKRSYFAIQLPHNWWVWGIDIQLESDVDEQQKSYFLEIKKEMTDGARVILCTAEPSWVRTSRREDSSYNNLHFFEEQIVCDKERDIRVSLTLAGDLHHYSRYTSSAEDLHRITAGGGGAFLHPTHNLPDKLVLESTGGLMENFDLKKCCPTKKESKGKVWQNLKFPYLNTGFTVILGAYFTVMLSLLHAWVQFVAPVGDRINDKIVNWFSFGFFEYLLGKVATNPLLIFVSLIFGYAFIAFTDTNPINSTRKKWYLGIAGWTHAALQLLLFGVLYLFLVKWNYSLFPGWINSWKEILLITILSVETFVLGGLISSHLFGFYLFITNRFFGMHDNEAFSALRSSSYKNFLRMHLTPEKLTIYPVGIRYSSKWRRNIDGIFTTTKITKPELIEKPIEILFETKRQSPASVPDIMLEEV